MGHKKLINESSLCHPAIKMCSIILIVRNVGEGKDFVDDGG